MSEIVLSPSVSNLEDRHYLAITGQFEAFKPRVINSADCCFKTFGSCGRPIPQFIDVNDPSDSYKNDFFTFAFEVASETYTLEATITNLTTEETNSITDNTFGVLNDIGDIVARPKVWTFNVDWNDVHSSMGFGEYQFTFVIKNGSGTTVETVTSAKFKLMQFDCGLAHGTVRIETKQTGYIFNGFDYTDLVTGFKSGAFVSIPLGGGWKQQIRWYGRLWADLPNEESDYIQSSNRIETQIQEKITPKFKLLLKWVRSEFAEQIINDNFLADEILISDFNMNNYDTYRDVQIRKVSTDEFNIFKLNKNANLVYTLKSVDEGGVKRIHG